MVEGGLVEGRERRAECGRWRVVGGRGERRAEGGGRRAEGGGLRVDWRRVGVEDGG